MAAKADCFFLGQDYDLLQHWFVAAPGDRWINRNLQFQNIASVWHHMLNDILVHLVRRPPHPANHVEGRRPRVHSLATPHPEPRGDPHRQDHEVLEHQHREVRGGGVGPRAIRAEQILFPSREGGGLIEATCNDSSSGNDVEDGEDPDFDHQLLELVNLGAAVLLLDHTPDPEERDEASREEGDSKDEIEKEG